MMRQQLRDLGRIVATRLLKVQRNGPCRGSEDGRPALRPQRSLAAGRRSHVTDVRSVLLLAAAIKGGNPEEVIPDQRPLNPLFVILQPSTQEVEGRDTDGGEADFMSVCRNILQTSHRSMTTHLKSMKTE